MRFKCREFLSAFVAVAMILGFSLFSIKSANATATDAPIITKVVQGTSGSLTIHVAPQVEGTENTWFYQVVNNTAGCANPYGNSATSNTSGAPASFSLSGLTNGCRYEVRVANWNGSTSPYTTVYAIPGVSKANSTCTSYASDVSLLNISPISGTTDCLVSVLAVNQNVQWVPTYGLTNLRFLAVGGGGAGSRGVCSAFWGAGGGGGEVLEQSSYSVTSSLWLNVGSGGDGNSSTACPAVNGSSYTTQDGSPTKIGTTSGASDVANARGGKGIATNPATTNTSGGKGGNSGNPLYSGATMSFSNDSCSSTLCASGGGGGAGGNASGKNGGAAQFSNITGTNLGFGGGGAGRDNNSFGTAGDGGAAGGAAASSATNNRGGGGSDISTGSAGWVGGGSGAIYLRFSNNGLTPIFDTPVKTSTGFTVNILNYDASYTWSTPTSTAGNVSISSTTGSKRKLTVTGLSAGQSATISQSTSRTGFTSINATTSSSALADTTAPSFTSSASFSAAENISPSTTAATIRVSESATITISAGVDAALFNILTSDSTTAVIRFKVSPNFEAPTDVGANNVYEITVRAVDGNSNAGTQAITITVTDVIDTSTFNSLSLAGSVTTTTYRASIVITANVTVPSRVRFMVNGKVLPGCANRITTGSSSSHSTTCTWKPANRGTVTLIATNTPIDGAISGATASPVRIMVGNRTGTR